MNYIFNVLWFEDNAGWYRLQKPTLESTVSEHCLQCNITPKRSSAFDIEELKATNYDLILMDYDLASKITGAHVISAIRDANILTDILFYSSQYDAMISAVASISPPLDGIYYSSRKLVKNSYDAGAHSVVITFQDLNGTNPQIIISDDGCGMSYDDILGKWLFVAYSAKKGKNNDRITSKMSNLSAIPNI